MGSPGEKLGPSKRELEGAEQDGHRCPSFNRYSSLMILFTLGLKNCARVLTFFLFYKMKFL